MQFTVVIPARHASTRLPGKMLADLAGKPMVVRVAERAAASNPLAVVVATDHADIANAVTMHGYRAVTTRPDHASGTDRIAEAVEALGLAPGHIVVNVQGDEPLMDPALIRAVAVALEQHPGAAIATACSPIIDAQTLLNSNVVKVVLDHDGYALYFSRAPIPYVRDAPVRAGASLPCALPAYRHIGLYAYRTEFLRAYTKLTPAPIERLEALEQLRAMWHGYRIAVTITSDSPHAGVDTADDLQRARKFFGAA